MHEWGIAHLFVYIRFSRVTLSKPTVLGSVKRWRELHGLWNPFCWRLGISTEGTVAGGFLDAREQCQKEWVFFSILTPLFSTFTLMNLLVIWLHGLWVLLDIRKWQMGPYPPSCLNLELLHFQSSLVAHFLHLFYLWPPHLSFDLHPFLFYYLGAPTPDHLNRILAGWGWRRRHLAKLPCDCICIPGSDYCLSCPCRAPPLLPFSYRSWLSPRGAVNPGTFTAICYFLFSIFNENFVCILVFIQSILDYPDL